MGPAAPYSQAGRRSRSFGLMETGVANTALDVMRLKPACDAAGARWKHAILRCAGAIAFDGCNRGFGAGTMTRVVRRSVDQQHFGTTRPVRAGRLCSEACSRGSGARSADTIPGLAGHAVLAGADEPIE